MLLKFHLERGEAAVGLERRCKRSMTISYAISRSSPKIEGDCLPLLLMDHLEGYPDVTFGKYSSQAKEAEE